MGCTCTGRPVNLYIPQHDVRPLICKTECFSKKKKKKKALVESKIHVGVQISSNRNDNKPDALISPSPRSSFGSIDSRTVYLPPRQE